MYSVDACHVALRSSVDLEAGASGSDGAKHVVSYEEDSKVHYEDSQAQGPASPEDDNCC